MKWISRIVMLIAIMGLNSEAFAAKKAKAAKAAAAGKAGGYGMAGCGLGSIVMGPKGNQISAATTNGSSYSQTFGVTTGTSNCSASTPAAEAAATAEREVFVTVNVENLSRQAAMGDGEHLYAFSEILGCNNSEGFDDFAEMSQTHFDTLFASKDATQIISAYVSEIAKTPSLATNCLRAG
jgi:hypothetical protein